MRNEFTIEATAAAFDTLSKKLYSNPILAVVRELSTNANDANIESGSSKSIELHVPNSEEPWFAVRDYGNGLSSEEVNLIYTSFFATTKSANDAVTGAFGLGSKSPFAVTNQFKVISYYNGKEYVYNMERVNGIPTCELVSESPSRELCGLYVEVPINRDIYIWIKTIHDFFMCTKFLPSFSSEEVFGNFEDYIKARDFFTRPSIAFDAPREQRGMHVNVAGVGFLNIDNGDSEVVKNLWDECRQLGINGVNLIAEKNDVTITPSREELHFDDKTNEWLNKAFHAQVAEFFSNITVDNIRLDQYLQLKRIDLVEYGAVNDVVYEVSKHLDNVNANIIYLTKDSRLASGYRAVSTAILPGKVCPCYIVDASGLNGQNLKAVQNLLINRGDTSSLNAKSVSYLRGKTADFSADYAIFVVTMKPIKTRKYLKQFGYDPKFVDVPVFFNKEEKAAKVNRSLLDKFITKACMCLEDDIWHDSRYIDRSKEYELYVTNESRIGYDTENQIKTYARIVGKNVIVRPNWNRDCPEYAKSWKDAYKEFCKSEQFQEAQKLVDAGSNIHHHLGLKCYIKDEELEAVLLGHPALLSVPEIKHWLEDCEFVRQNKARYDNIRYTLSYTKITDVITNGSKFPMLKLEPKVDSVDDIEVIAQYIESCLLK